MQAIAAQVKEKVVIAERALLYVLGFQLDVGYPFECALIILTDTQLGYQATCVLETGEIEPIGEALAELRASDYLERLVENICHVR